MKCIKLIKQYNVILKINTVVSRYNINADLNEFILKVKPYRWKIFRALPIKNENQAYTQEFCVDLHEFKLFKKKHQVAQDATCLVSESNYQMPNSYLMVYPQGFFFDNTNWLLKYRSPILKVGVK